jgi:hypothetical protein
MRRLIQIIQTIGLLALAALLAAGCSGSSKDKDGSISDAPPASDNGGSGDQSTQDLPPLPTHVIVTEFMADPSAVFDNAGEWFEIHNPTAQAVDLAGWTIKDEKTDSHVIQGPLSIGPGQYLVLARNKDPSQNGGIQGAYQYESFNLAQAGDQIVLLDASGAQVNRVAYTAAWGINAGVSNALKVPNLDNTQQANWCPSKDVWAGSAGDRGSPGGPNTCGTVTPPKDGGVTDGLPYLQHYLSFNESLCASIGSGAKKITLRNGHDTYIAVGEWIKLICSTSKTTYKAQVTEVRHTTWGGITPQEYGDDGFSSQAQMLATMQTYYPGITLNDPATVYRWTGTAPYP